jgi:hypothetical protein
MTSTRGRDRVSAAAGAPQQRQQGLPLHLALGGAHQTLHPGVLGILRDLDK